MVFCTLISPFWWQKIKIPHSFMTATATKTVFEQTTLLIDLPSVKVSSGLGRHICYSMPNRIIMTSQPFSILTSIIGQAVQGHGTAVPSGASLLSSPTPVGGRFFSRG
jgi:hypothetical protein